MSETIRIIVADDHLSVRQMLTKMLRSEEQFVVVAEASDGEEAARQTLLHHPDVLLLDLNMPGTDGLECIRELAQKNCPSKILVLTAQEDERLLLEALQAGAHGYLLKSASLEEIVCAVRTTAADGTALSSRSAAQLLEIAQRSINQSRQTALDEKDLELLERLSDREREVLRYLSQGLSNKEIGETLFISELTVKTHVQNLLRRLELRDRFQAAALGIRLRLPR